MFAPEFAVVRGEQVEALDLDKTLFEGRPIAKLIEQARQGSDQERADAILGLEHVHHGCHAHCRHSMHRAPPPEIRRRMLALAEGGRIGQRAPLLLPLMGSDAVSAVPTLQTMQNDQREDVARAVSQALESIQGRPR